MCLQPPSVRTHLPFDGKRRFKFGTCQEELVEQFTSLFSKFIILRTITNKKKKNSNFMHNGFVLPLTHFKAARGNKKYLVCYRTLCS